MSWRDRLARHDPGACSRAASTATEAIGTIGAIGNEEFSATTRDGGVTESCRRDYVSTPDLLPDPAAESAESADRGEKPDRIANGADAVSAESANSADDGDVVAKQCSANSDESVDSAGDRDALWRHSGEERAAIVEHESKIPRAWAEGFARLHPDRPPRDVPRRRWQTFIDDCGRFLEGSWAERAVALGWGPLDLFGADCDKPFARIDQSGLIWLLNGDRLIALGENTATIETRTGKPQIWRRKPSQPGRVLVWKLTDDQH